MRDSEARFKYPAVCFSLCLNVYFTFSTRLASPKVDEKLSMGAKETGGHLDWRETVPVSQPQHMLG